MMNNAPLCMKQCMTINVRRFMKQSTSRSVNKSMKQFLKRKTLCIQNEWNDMAQWSTFQNQYIHCPYLVPKIFVCCLLWARENLCLYKWNVQVNSLKWQSNILSRSQTCSAPWSMSGLVGVSLALSLCWFATRKHWTLLNLADGSSSLRTTEEFLDTLLTRSTLLMNQK